MPELFEKRYYQDRWNIKIIFRSQKVFELLYELESACYLDK